MSIELKLDVVMADRKVRLKDLAEKVGITLANLSNLKNGKAKAIRFSTLNAICHHLACEPGDLIRFNPDPEAQEQLTDEHTFAAPDISLPPDFLD
ncbi:MAG: helix-turn-helix domain-containing protein [Verrucomicrobiota bacterium]